MTEVVTTKFTHQELELMEYMTRCFNVESASQLLRTALLDLAVRSGVPESILENVRAARQCQPPRRSPKLCKLIGPRRRGEKLKGGHV